MDGSGFFRILIDGQEDLTADQFWEIFVMLAAELPGLGGLETVERLRLGEVEILLDRLAERSRKQVARIEAAKAKNASKSKGRRRR